MAQKFLLAKRLLSFKYAIQGLKVLVNEEHNARIHFVAGLVAVAIGWICKLQALEWVVLIVCIGFVIAMEAVNTSIENLSDFVSPDKDEKIRKVKDIGAVAVLISALTALIVGGIIFIPKILVLFRLIEN